MKSDSNDPSDRFDFNQVNLLLNSDRMTYVSRVNMNTDEAEKREKHINVTLCSQEIHKVYLSVYDFPLSHGMCVFVSIDSNASGAIG